MSEPSIEALDAALAHAAPAVTAQESRLAVAILRALALGRPVTTGHAAAAAGVAAADATAIVRAWPAVYWEHDRIIGFWGLALPEMPHRLTVAGVQVHAWCAWDPMFLARVVGDMRVSTDDPVSGEQISYVIESDGAMRALSHPSSVLSFLRPDRPWDDTVMTTFCHHVMHFTNEASARRWTADRPGTFVLGIEHARELARRHAARLFGEALGQAKPRG